MKKRYEVRAYDTLIYHGQARRFWTRIGAGVWASELMADLPYGVVGIFDLKTGKRLL